jgi:serine/threonine-protein kinase
MATERELRAGETVGPYRLEEILGEGAVGIVFRAIREPDGETVALKLLRRALSHDQTYVRRFLHEAQAAQEVQQRHLVEVIEAGEADGRHYLATTYVAGGSLADRLDAEQRLPIDAAVRIAAEVGAGLDALHRAGLVHRDVKPSNVMLDERGRALLTDFGLAKGPAYTVLTRPGQVLGTLDYLAPELIGGAEATPASDLYALGCIVYECLVGAPPFGRRGLLEVASAHLLEEPADPTEARSNVTPALSWGVLQALAKDPKQRPPSATTYAHVLRAAVSELP